VVEAEVNYPVSYIRRDGEIVYRVCEGHDVPAGSLAAFGLLRAPPASARARKKAPGRGRRPRTKLTGADRVEIVRLHVEEHASIRRLAVKFKVSRGQVSQIIAAAQEMRLRRRATDA